uniref:J domain-containing protein n=1 Tax=Salix viminalis TaxID=40686 RepID=A0A6N2MW68_SALVM
MGLELETRKSQLVFEICSLSTLLVSCVHRHHSSSCDPVESHFIDWYRILGVDENAGLEVMKRRYHKLGKYVLLIVDFLWQLCNFTQIRTTILKLTLPSSLSWRLIHISQMI